MFSAIKRFRRFWFLYAVLCLLTWGCGWVSYAHDVQRSAQIAYDNLQRVNAPGVKLFREGPEASVPFCVPLAPGIMLAQSSRAVGPLDGEGGLKVVVFYGWGTAEVLVLWGWVS